MFRSQQIIIREYISTPLNLLDYLKNTEFKILKIIPGVMAAKRVAGIRGDPCGAVRIPATWFIATKPGMIFRILNSEFFKLFSNFSEVQTYSLVMIC